MSELLTNFFPNPEFAATALEQAYLSNPSFFEWYNAVSRVVLALLAVAIVARCLYSLFSTKNHLETWCYFDTLDGYHIPIHHWENIIGRSLQSDIVLNVPTVSRNHAAIIRESDGSYSIIDLESKGGVYVGGEKIQEKRRIEYGEIVDISGVKGYLRPLNKDEEKMSTNRDRPNKISHMTSLYLLSVFQLVAACALIFNMPERFRFETPISFILLLGFMWFYTIFFKIIKRVGFEIDIMAFFLATLGLIVAASFNPTLVAKQFIAILCGLAGFLALGTYLRDLKRAVALRPFMGFMAVGLLLFTVVAGTIVNGARNWIFIGGISIQPSEIAKIAFVYAGSATLATLLTKHNLMLFLGLTISCAGLLAIMGDFGAAIIFFIAFIVAAYMRSGDLRTIALILGGAFFAFLIVIRFRPYILNRFSAWRNAWTLPHDGGYQQSRTMSASASGGLFGTGAGTGWLKDIPASNTDLVFGYLSEEMGLIVALCAAACIIGFAVFSAKSAINARSTFYSIAACTASAMMVFQMILNVFGSLDILPLTGVTFPFVSTGGSSIVSCFGLLAFIKAADNRQNASFAAPLQQSILKKSYKNES